MIDLHCHLLPGVDDGARDLDTALAMARIAVADGIHTAACTPHIYPGLYANNGSGIRAGVLELQRRLDEAGIPLALTYGADAHMAPDLVANLRNGIVPTLHGSRYLLLEPPHHVAPPRLEELAFALSTAGYVPIITHPERLTWMSDAVMAMFSRMVRGGAWMQVTAGSLTGRFGPQAQRWGKRMLAAGLVHLLATDAHDTRRRAPRLAEGRQAAAAIVGAEEAHHLVVTRPQGILENAAPARFPVLRVVDDLPLETREPTFLGRLFGRNHRLDA